MLKQKGDTTEILREVLDIIDYKDDKERFIDSFIIQAQKQAAINILAKLPKDKRKQLQEEEENQELFAEIFTPEVMDNAMVDVMVMQFQGFLQTVIPKLSVERKEKLVAYLDSLAVEDNSKN